ncbi:hypothetical protein HELRODRAFT_74868 [Helobdella robusta]|uniref:Trans-1,2-dihydrobenzene-1,2-diol dehydrogenase n=1 Tax=Helobdella robusta TaxID=6412 RepID=T1G1W7_HELRO|nr:hypothetical protein HELRODRAFT_74868 [Helobdella robusta]ESO08619.1 hypothetical protein HELRODRAFT_74868 [Helobdella robusta]
MNSINQPSIIPPSIKWGVIGTGKIAEDFCIAVQLSGLNHIVLAVASRSLDSAKKFASKFDIKICYDRYVDLYLNADIDVVYIGTVTSSHYQCTLQALQNGKPILCEKPLTTSLFQCKQLLDYAKSKNLLLVEGLWSRFLPTYDILNKALVNKTIGKITELRVNFGKKFDWNSSVQITKKDLGGGTTLGLGCYALHLACIVFNSEKPKEVTASGNLNKNGLDEKVEIKLVYANDQTALISLSTICDYQNDAVISGSKGSIILKDFWCCETIIICGKPSTKKMPNDHVATNYPKTIGFVYEIEQIGKCLNKKEIEAPQARHCDSLLVAEISDEIFNQLGICYT